MKIKRIIALSASLLPDACARVVYRYILGARVGRGVKFGIGSMVLADELTIDDGVAVGAFARITAARCRLGVRSVIGPQVVVQVREIDLDSRARLAKGVHIVGNPRSPDSIARLGKRAWVFEWTYINVDRPVSIGKNSGVGGYSCIFTHGSWLSQLDGYPVVHAPVTIEDEVWLPWGCFILPGVTVGCGSVVGARTVVNRDVPAYALVAGIPAKVIKTDVRKPVSDDERLQILGRITEDYARSSGMAAAVTPRNGDLLISIDGVDVVYVHRDDVTERRLHAGDGLLHLFLRQPTAPLPDGLAWFRLDDKSSSPEKTFPPLALGWLEHATRFGVRYYPIDE